MPLEEVSWILIHIWSGNSPWEDFNNGKWKCSMQWPCFVKAGWGKLHKASSGQNHSRVVHISSQRVNSRLSLLGGSKWNKEWDTFASLWMMNASMRKMQKVALDMLRTSHHSGNGTDKTEYTVPVRVLSISWIPIWHVWTPRKNCLTFLYSVFADHQTDFLGKETSLLWNETLNCVEPSFESPQAHSAGVVSTLECVICLVWSRKTSAHCWLEWVRVSPQNKKHSFILRDVEKKTLVWVNLHSVSVSGEAGMYGVLPLILPRVWLWRPITTTVIVWTTFFQVFTTVVGDSSAYNLPTIKNKLLWLALCWNCIIMCISAVEVTN